MIGRLRAQIVKELLSVLRDPKARFMLIGPPLAQLVIFSFSATLDVHNAAIAVLDNDHSAVSRELIERVRSASFVGRFMAASSLADLGSRVERQDVLLALQIPQDLGRNVAAGRPARVQVLLDGRRANSAQIALGYLGTIARNLSLDLVAPDVRAAAPRAVVRNWFNPNLTYQWFIVPSLSGILAMFISLLVTALSIARERELGTFDQLIVSPATSLEIIVAKIVPALVIGTGLSLAMVGAGVLIFRIPFTGSLPMLLGSLALFILSVVGIGLMISSICQTQQQAILGTFSVGIPTILISGFATPVENMPAWLRVIAQASPLTHYLVIVQGISLKALPLGAVFAHAWPLAAIAAVTLTLAVIVVKRRLR